LKLAEDFIKDLNALSPPMRGRGLKLQPFVVSVFLILVAPHAGAWIETCGVICSSYPVRVAPHAGAWIETVDPHLGPGRLESPPMRGRGLKPSTPD